MAPPAGLLRCFNGFDTWTYINPIWNPRTYWQSLDVTWVYMKIPWMLLRSLGRWCYGHTWTFPLNILNPIPMDDHLPIFPGAITAIVTPASKSWDFLWDSTSIPVAFPRLSPRLHCCCHTSKCSSRVRTQSTSSSHCPGLGDHLGSRFLRKIKPMGFYSHFPKKWSTLW